MFCQRRFVQYNRIFLLFEYARSTQAYCEFFLFFSVFRYFSGVLRVLRVEILQNNRKTPQNTRKTPQNTTKHHKTHLLTKQPEFANKPALAPCCPPPCGGFWPCVPVPPCGVVRMRAFSLLTRLDSSHDADTFAFWPPLARSQRMLWDQVS